MADTAYLRVVFGLIFVIAAILACAWMARRAGIIKHTHGRLLRIVTALSLGPRQRIAVVEVQGTWLVVGLSAGQMTLLHTLAAPVAEIGHDTGNASNGHGDAIGDLSPSASLAAKASAAFAGKLSQALKRR